MALFDLPDKRSTKSSDSKIIKKATSKKSSVKTIKSGNSILGRINEIKAMVQTNLGKYADDYIVITDEKVLHDYIDSCIENKYISIDTETDGLDPLQNKLAGICIYTYGQKGAYIPLNHISYITGVKASNQLDMELVMSEFKRLLVEKPDIDMFNAKFDIRFLRANGLTNIYCTWDSYLASHLLNENEPSHGLKPLHKKYVLNGQGDAFSFDALFKDIPFTMIPYNVGYLYAAHDPVITTELCDYQRPYLTAGTSECKEYNLTDVAWVFHNIEMPCLSVVADMEDTGIELDIDYASKLSQEYNKQLEEKIQRFYDICSMYDDEIEQYKKKNLKHKLSEPINIASPTQIAILLYDIMKIKPVDKDNIRGTGEDILLKIDNDITKAILDYRSVAKLISTYIDKLPECVNPKDGRIHCSFNQYGARTGRFSSNDPNLQNIPSKNHDIRKMFKATDNEEVLITEDGVFIVYRWDEVYTKNGWITCNKLKIGDDLDGCIIKSIVLQDDYYKIIV